MHVRSECSANRRPRLQFSLRALFALLTVAAVAVAWVGHKYHAYLAEQAVIAELPNAVILSNAQFES